MSIQSSNLFRLIEGVTCQLQASNDDHVLVHLCQFVLCDIHFQTYWIKIVRLKCLRRQIDGEMFIFWFRDFCMVCVACCSICGYRSNGKLRLERTLRQATGRATRRGRARLRASNRSDIVPAMRMIVLKGEMKLGFSVINCWGLCHPATLQITQEMGEKVPEPAIPSELRLDTARDLYSILRNSYSFPSSTQYLV